MKIPNITLGDKLLFAHFGTATQLKEHGGYWWPLTFLSLYLKVCGETAVLVLANFQNSTLKRRLAVYVY